MADRSANATIKGYLYQFDHTILQILALDASESNVIVEGVEDIDLEKSDEMAFIQCKYYEGTEYQHSLIKEAVIEMCRHFNSHQSLGGRKLTYRIYGHYRTGHAKLPSSIDVQFLQEKFLTYSREKITHRVYEELHLDDAKLNRFLSLLQINILGSNYDNQQREVEQALGREIIDSTAEDIKHFYYPRALNVIQRLAIKKTREDRKINKQEFIKEINTKEAVFSIWLIQKFGDDYYERSVKRQFFHWGTTKVPRRSRIFILDVPKDSTIGEVCHLLASIGERFSHKEHNRTIESDRFCPYVHLSGVTREFLVGVKANLVAAGIPIRDGYQFDGAEFSAEYLVRLPNKNQPIKMKFIDNREHIVSVISRIVEMLIEIFVFSKEGRSNINVAPFEVVRHIIPIRSLTSIEKMI